MSLTREKLLKKVKQMLIGPDPLPGFVQENGEEILFSDSPLKTYVTGVLFPQIINTSELEDESEQYSGENAEEGDVIPELMETTGKSGTLPTAHKKAAAEIVQDGETSKINNYKQSAMGLTMCIPSSAETICVEISVGSYFEKEMNYPREKRDSEGNVKIVLSDNKKRCYLRKGIKSTVEIAKADLPTEETRYYQDKYQLLDENNVSIEGLGISITYRMYDATTDSFIYTVTLLNTKKSTAKYSKVEDCWFQAEFSVICESGYAALPDNFCAEIHDEDYQLNSLLYREVKTYAIGHGCAATWDDSTESAPHKVTATVMPEYDVKPIVQGKSSAVLSMKTYFENREETVRDLSVLCDEYEEWIKAREADIAGIEDKHIDAALRQIDLAKKCLARMRTGITLIQKKDNVWTAFSFANKAMLMQQLHYKLPLTEYSGFDTETFEMVLATDIKLPDFDDEATWYNPDGKNVYGKWRPFQIAFILMNLLSMSDKKSTERQIVDLIWFPTGGGKTEAYLGLTAFTILYRRLNDPVDSGTNVIMRYTLRLLTAQQYERAASLICSLEKIRSENISMFGEDRITIGLWVGDSLTDNNSKDVIKRIRDVQKGTSAENISVMLKCPWCGASMETFKKGKTNETPGYVISGDKKHVLFCCANPGCDYHEDTNPLPLTLFDDEIYAVPPTLLFGTVDKFATLPFRPQAKSLFGGDGIHTPPELIIQDELHLITGPLGSTVGLYETLVNRLCTSENHFPKIIASTATISHAKQQCNALYNCGEENVFQFPVQGLSYRDCFFAKENKQAVGRKYVGLYGAAASSSAFASIYTFAAFLYAAKEIEVDNEKDRDPYWTDLSYFGSMRELGQAATWYIADIKERLEVIYQSRLQSADKTKRRYIYEGGLAELTSRMSNDQIPQILKALEVEYLDKDKYPLDMCLATNMVSVGVDVSRLGLMTVTGQPKSFSEYIQATSRVGRSSNAPGLVLVIYNTSKPRDKSYYEKFQSQHSKLYKNVEPTSVTPFSRPLRDRALHAIFVALHRFYADEEARSDASQYPSDAEFNEIQRIIIERASNIDPEAVEDIKEQLHKYLEEWQSWTPSKYEDNNMYTRSPEAPLMYVSGTIPLADWGDRGWKTQMAMRNVDRECQLDCSKILRATEEE